MHCIIQYPVKTVKTVIPPSPAIIFNLKFGMKKRRKLFRSNLLLHV